MPICIYCQRDSPREAFNKEHVVPRQFGSFANSPTLVRAVCTDCNRFFGNTLELVLGRDSLEAIYRLRHHQKLPKDFEGFSGARLNFRLPANTPGAGVVVVPEATEDGTEIILKLPAQIGVQIPPRTEYTYYTEDDLKGAGIDRLPAPKIKANLRLLAAASDEPGFERLREIIRTRFPKFEERGEIDLPPPERIGREILVEIKASVDKLIARAISKITFNYMAKYAGPDFATNSSFDPIRRFIRYDDVEDWHQFIRFVHKPLLAEETEALIVTRGHIMRMHWLDPVQGRLQAVFSPYNSIAYEVTLCRSFSGILRPLNIGHVFDWEHQQVIGLQPIKRLILPVGWSNRAARAYQHLTSRPFE